MNIHFYNSILFSISQYAYRMLESIENEIEYFFLIFRAAMVLDVCIPSQHFDVECSVFLPYRRSHRRCSVKKGVFKISQISRENTCVGVSF